MVSRGLHFKFSQIQKLFNRSTANPFHIKLVFVMKKLICQEEIFIATFEPINETLITAVTTVSSSNEVKPAMNVSVTDRNSSSNSENSRIN